MSGVRAPTKRDSLRARGIARNVTYNMHVWRATVRPRQAAKKKKRKNLLQLLYGPQIVPDVRDRLDSDALVHHLHLLRPKLRDPNPDRELLALRLKRDRRARSQRRVHRREPPARGRQPGTHHVCAREQEADRAAIDADVWEYERI